MEVYTQYSPLIVYGFALILILGGALMGLRKRFLRSLVKLVAAVVAATVAFFVIRHLYVEMASPENIQVVIDTVATQSNDSEVLATLQAEMPNVLPLFLLLVFSLIGAILYPAVFSVCRILIGIVSGIICLLLPRRKGFTPLSSLSGALLGAVRGAVFTFLVLFPFVGYASMATDVMAVTNAAFSQNEEYAQVSVVVEQVIEPIQSHPLSELTRFVGGDKLFTALTSFTYTTEEGENIEVVWENESTQYTKIATHVWKLRSIQLDSIDQTQVDEIKALAEDVKDSDSISILLAECLSGVCGAWSEGRPFMGEAKPAVDDENIQAILDTAIDTFKDTTPATVGEDLMSVAELFEVMVKYDALENFKQPDNLLELIKNDEFLTEFIGVMKDNPRLETLLKETVKTGVKTVVESAADQDEFNDAVNAFNQAAADQLNALASYPTPEEKQEAVAEAITAALADHNITEGEAAVDYVAELLVEEFADEIESGTVTPEAVAEYLGLKSN